MPGVGSSTFVGAGGAAVGWGTGGDGGRAPMVDMESLSDGGASQGRFSDDVPPIQRQPWEKQQKKSLNIPYRSVRCILAKGQQDCGSGRASAFETTVGVRCVSEGKPLIDLDMERAVVNGFEYRLRRG